MPGRGEGEERRKRKRKRKRATDSPERLGHDFRTVVDREDDVCDTGGGERLDLVLDHGLVGELDERLGVSERLCN